MVDRSVQEQHLEALAPRIEVLEGLGSKLDRVESEHVTQTRELVGRPGCRTRGLRLKSHHALSARCGGVEAVDAVARADVQHTASGERDAVEEIIEVEPKVPDVAFGPLGVDDGKVTVDAFHEASILGVRPVPATVGAAAESTATMRRCRRSCHPTGIAASSLRGAPGRWQAVLEQVLR